MVHLVDQIALLLTLVMTMALQPIRLSESGKRARRRKGNLGRNSQNRNRLTSTPEFQVTASDNKCHPTTDEEDVDPVESSIHDSFMPGMNSP